MAESIFSPKVCSCRERKRANSAVVITCCRHRASSIAASTVPVARRLILDEAGKILQLRILGQRCGAKVEQPKMRGRCRVAKPPRYPADASACSGSSSGRSCRSPRYARCRSPLRRPADQTRSSIPSCTIFGKRPAPAWDFVNVAGASRQHCLSLVLTCVVIAEPGSQGAERI